MKLDPRDLMDNDFSVIGNKFTEERNIYRKANLSVKQAIEIAKHLVDKEILDNMSWVCPYCGEENPCHGCNSPRPNFLYESDVYSRFAYYVSNLSLSMDGKVLELLGSVFATQLKDKKKDKRDDKLESE